MNTPLPSYFAPPPPAPSAGGPPPPPVLLGPVFVPPPAPALDMDAYLQYRVRFYKSRYRHCVVGLSVALFSGYLTVLLSRVATLDGAFLTFCAAILFMSSVLFFCVEVFSGRRVQTDIAEMMTQGGVQAVGPLLDLSRIPGRAAGRLPVYGALTHLLPLMKASDAPLLNAGQRAALNRLLTGAGFALRHGPSRLEFVLAALKALEQIGDSSSIPTVQRLAEMRTLSPGRRRIRQAALDCLPALQQNAGLIGQAQDLLRASHEPAANPNLLLRPAVSTHDPAPQELLRAAGGSGSELPPDA